MHICTYLVDCFMQIHKLLIFADSNEMQFTPVFLTTHNALQYTKHIENTWKRSKNVPSRRDFNPFASSEIIRN